MSENGTERIAISASQFFENRDDEREWVSLPELAAPGDPDPSRYGIYVRAISASEHERLTKTSAVIVKQGRETIQRIDMPKMRVRIVAMAAINPDGSRMFSEDHLGKIGQQSARIVERISDVALRLASIEDDTTPEDGEDAVPGKDALSKMALTGSASTWPSPSAFHEAS